MNLINELRAKSNNVEDIKKEVIKEITSCFDKYLDGEKFENYLRQRISDDDIRNRKFYMGVNFWEYHDGCSTTHFSCGGLCWYNPENKDGYQSCEYKGIELNTIDKEVGVYLSDKLERTMTELGFELLSKERRKSRFDYYQMDYYFGW